MSISSNIPVVVCAVALLATFFFEGEIFLSLSLFLAVSAQAYPTPTSSLDRSYYLQSTPRFEEPRITSTFIHGMWPPSPYRSLWCLCCDRDVVSLLFNSLAHTFALFYPDPWYLVWASSPSNPLQALFRTWSYLQVSPPTLIAPN